MPNKRPAKSPHMLRERARGVIGKRADRVARNAAKRMAEKEVMQDFSDIVQTLGEKSAKKMAKMAYQSEYDKNRFEQEIRMQFDAAAKLAANHALNFVEGGEARNWFTKQQRVNVTRAMKTINREMAQSVIDIIYSRRDETGKGEAIQELYKQHVARARGAIFNNIPKQRHLATMTFGAYIAEEYKALESFGLM